MSLPMVVLNLIQSFAKERKVSFTFKAVREIAILRLDESRKLRENAIELYRKKYRLLLGDEIQSIRERNQLTQAQFALLFKLGVNTLSRWESGRNVQSSAMDVLLRLIRDVPRTLAYLQGLVA